MGESKSKIIMFSILLNFIIGLSFALGVPIGGGVLRHKRKPIGLDFHLDKRDASAMKHAMEDFQSGPWSPWNYVYDESDYESPVDSQQLMAGLGGIPGGQTIWYT